MMISVGKIGIFLTGKRITESNKSKSLGSWNGADDRDCRARFYRLCFVNLVDFDALWGHRRNVKGYAEELERLT